MDDKTSLHIEQVMEEHGEYLIRLAFMYVKDWEAAEDIVQDVFIRYYQNSEQFEQRSSLKTYLCKITVNRCYDHLRSWKNKKSNFTNALVELLSNKTNPENQAIRKTENSALFKEIMSLPMKYREVILLFYYQEMKIAEISLVLNCTENTVKSRLSRARTQLKNRLNENEWEGFHYE
ncbi:RNA polymerase sigma factor [Paenisporosarcina indica]|uniref:RNA polymerase sigma factor n=1 Tax=Paenisporosarcina indica TaxID=650093 RepID=UPI00094F8270|nr:sigma-70 family RNA polymerase sigma factor [Paenisporosarcina indica]